MIFTTQRKHKIILIRRRFQEIPDDFLSSLRLAIPEVIFEQGLSLPINMDGLISVAMNSW